nr:STAS/SEC14 domain-containing protein [Anaerolineae bacterium]
MPYQLDRLEYERDILSIKLYEPLSNQETEDLAAEARGVFTSGSPVYLMLDLREFDLAKSLGRLGAAFEDIPFPQSGSRQTDQSRVAVIGGGPILKLILQMTNALSEQTAYVRLFSAEDQAITWLREQMSGGEY